MKKIKITTLLMLIMALILFLYRKSNVEIPKEIVAYNSILNGNFTSISDEECQNYMNYLYNLNKINGKPKWKYIIMDFNKDGVEDLFVQLSTANESALFTYQNGNIKWIYIDAVEANCFTYPLLDGRFVEVYDYWTACTITVYEVNSDFGWTNSVQYIRAYNLDYDTLTKMIDENGDLQIPTANIEYYYQDSTSLKKEIDIEEWNQINNYIIENCIPEKEWLEL